MVLNIISEHSEEEKIEALRPHFKERGIKLMVLYPCSAFMAKAAALKAPKAILWISTKTNPDLFDIATERNNRGLTTINYFADEVSLSESQKNAVGRNRSVFASLHPSDYVDEILSVIKTDSLNTKSQATSINAKSTETSTPPQTTNQSGKTISQVEEVKNVVDSTIDSENPNEKEEGYKPGKALLVMVITTLVIYIIGHSAGFSNDQILPYIMYGVGFFIDLAGIGGVWQYQEKNGKSFFSQFVVIIGWICLLYLGITIIINLYSWLFD